MAATLSFRQLDKKHHKPIRMDRVSSVDGKTVPWDDKVKGFEISKGKFVIVEDEDFAAAAPQMSRVIDLTDFVPADSIDPRYFDSPYFLVPQKGCESTSDAKVRPAEHTMAVQLIENLADEFDPSKYKDEYQAKLKAIIKAKAKGKPLAAEDFEEPENTRVLDLVSRLEQSLAESGKRGAKKTGGKKNVAEKSTAKETARKRKSA